MKIDITDLLAAEDRVVELEAETELTSFQLKPEEFPIREKAPFLLHLENHKKQYIRVWGETDILVSFPCDRCLEDVPVSLHLVIDRKFGLQKAEGEEEPGSEDWDELKGTDLDVDGLIYDEILMRRPLKVLCRDDCKGLCKKCGANLNKGNCFCEREELDPRMAAILDVFNQYKEV